MISPWIQKIVDQRIPCVFVSPHLDDAALSAGGLLSYLADRTSVQVITVFTEAAPPPHTLSARAFIRQCGFRQAEPLFLTRRQEDQAAFRRLNIATHHLGYVDATWRKLERVHGLRRLIGRLIPEFLHRYPIHRLHITRDQVHADDRTLIDQFTNQLRLLVPQTAPAVVFAPSGIGTHIDHVIVRNVCLDIFSDVILWLDFPYHCQSVQPEAEHLVGRTTELWDRNGEQKRRLIAAYHSQVGALFHGQPIPTEPETYFVPVAQGGD